jgi:hypothetical protein
VNRGIFSDCKYLIRALGVFGLYPATISFQSHKKATIINPLKVFLISISCNFLVNNTNYG